MDDSFTILFDAESGCIGIVNSGSNFVIGEPGASGTSVNIASGSFQDVGSVQDGPGDSTIVAGAGAETVDGGAGNDQIDADDGDDVVRGGDGNDTIDGGSGNDTIYGGSSIDGPGIDPLVLLNFEDGASGTASDSTSNGFDSIYQGDAASGGSGWNGNGTGVVLDGSGDYVEIPDDPTFDLNSGVLPP